MAPRWAKTAPANASQMLTYLGNDSLQQIAAPLPELTVDIGSRAEAVRSKTQIQLQPDDQELSLVARLVLFAASLFGNDSLYVLLLLFAQVLQFLHLTCGEPRLYLFV